jgi:uncharacterized protein
MSLAGERILLRAYLREADRPPHVPTYDMLLKSARAAGLAGASVFRGILGLGSTGLLRPSAWSLFEHVPVLVEIVDSSERITEFVEGTLARLVTHGLVTLERAHVMMYRQRRGEPPASSLSLGGLLRPLSTVPRVRTGGHMKVNQDGVLLRVFIGESDVFEGKPLYEAIVARARELGLAGATVLRGTEGFGANSVVHKARLLEMSSDLPIVIEIVETEAKVRTLLPHLEAMVTEGMITMEYVTILLYRHDPADAPGTT